MTMDDLKPKQSAYIRSVGGTKAGIPCNGLGCPG